MADLICPKCGASELTHDRSKLHIRAFKHTDAKGKCWSHCLVCAGYYSKHNGRYHEALGSMEKGWFTYD